MKSLIVILVLSSATLTVLAQAHSAAPLERIDSKWVYINKGLKWESPPQGTAAGVQYCDNALLVVLVPSGEYFAVSPVLYREVKTKSISISRGDGMAVRKGLWKIQKDGSLHIESRMVYTPLPERGRTYPSDYREEVWKLSGTSGGRIAAILRSSTHSFVPILNFKDFEFLAKYISAETPS